GRRRGRRARPGTWAAPSRSTRPAATSRRRASSPGVRGRFPCVSATTVSRVDNGRRLTGADGLRAFAALWVVFSHLYQRLDLRAQTAWLQDFQVLMMKGAFGVSIFFVLSGMLLSFPFWKAYL